MAKHTVVLLIAAFTVMSCLAFAGGEITRTTSEQTVTRVAAPPPYPADLECRYQAIKNSRGMAWYKAPPAIPFSRCGPLAPTVRDKFGFGPFVDGFDFEPGGRLNPVTPYMVGAVLSGGWHGHAGWGVTANIPIGNPPVGNVTLGYRERF